MRALLRYRAWALIERLPKLKLLVTTGWRNASIDQRATAERGIPVCGTYMFHSTTMELTWALILALVRNIVIENQSLRLDRWQTTLGVMLQGKVLGIVGLGDLGSKIAAVAKAFQIEVIAWSQNLTVERMMYGRPSANYQFPSSMWLLPGGLNGWLAARDFQGLNQERIECSHQMVLGSSFILLITHRAELRCLNARKSGGRCGHTSWLLRSRTRSGLING